jgi:hypothetical protein
VPNAVHAAVLHDQRTDLDPMGDLMLRDSGGAELLECHDTPRVTGDIGDSLFDCPVLSRH